MNMGRQCQFTLQERAASVEFLWVGLVVWRSTTDWGCDAAVGQLETVSGGERGWLGGESGLVECAKEEVSGTIAGEHTAGAVGPVGAGSEADKQYFGVEGAKRRHWSSPVIRVLVRFALRLGDPDAVFAKPGASVAGGDLCLEASEGPLRRRGHGRSLGYKRLGMGCKSWREFRKVLRLGIVVRYKSEP